MKKWLDIQWWRYVFEKPVGHGLSYWTVVFCRMRGHASVNWFNPGGLEPDMHCSRCGEDLG